MDAKGVRFDQESPHALLERESLSEAERAALLEEYVTRGRALRLEGDRGIVDSARRRAANLGQFFTPTRVARVLAQAVGLAPHPALDGEGPGPNGSVVDFAGCGNGRLLQFAPPGWSRHGADVDPLACRAARLVFPDAEIIQASLLEFRRQGGHGFTVALVNPPFSVTLGGSGRLDLKCAQWGVGGQATSAVSHVAALELGMNMAQVVGAILPTSALSGDGAKAIEKALGSYRRMAWRLDLPADAFEAEGTEWPCSVVLFTSGYGASVCDGIACATWEAVEAALAEWVRGGDEHGHPIQVVRRGSCGEDRPTLASWRVEARTAEVEEDAAPAAVGGEPVVRMSLGGRAHQIRLLGNGVQAALAIKEARLWQGWVTSGAFEPQSMLEWSCDLVRNAGRAVECIRDVAAALRSVGVRVEVDEQLRTHARRADRRAAAEMTPFAQWVRVGEGWREVGGEAEREEAHIGRACLAARTQLFAARATAIPAGLRVKRWDRAQACHVEQAWPGFPVYDFAQEDVARVLGRRGVIYSAKQGLGKARFGVAAVLAAGVQRAVWVLETRLISEFKRELGKLGLLSEFHQIETAADLRHLRSINVISYSRLWRPVREGGEKRAGAAWGPGKSFAAALARRGLMVVVDEAHKLKAADSKQGIAGRLLCNRARRVVLMTGTAIQSYPRNILGLVNAGWGDGSAFNPYGYRRGVLGNYQADSGRHREPVIKGVTRFCDEYVDTLWVTPQFEQTASSGAKSREIPRVKDMGLWESFVRAKIIRRVPAEPRVRASGVRTPEARPEFVAVPPAQEHLVYYHRVLDRFAAIWKARIERERDSGKVESNAAHILPELDALRFASTVPVEHHKWRDEDPTLVYTSKEPTALMVEAMRRISAWVEGGDRVLVAAEKPAALRWLCDLLLDLPRYVPDAEPIAAVLAHDSNIQRRNALIDRVRDDSRDPVLMLSVGMGKEGLNLPQFSKLLTLDLGWVPGDLDQVRHRILRPDQQGDVQIVHLLHDGMIDAYMRQLCDAKADAIAEAVDRQRSTFNYENWMTFRDFAISMLEREGYEFAARALGYTRRAAA